MAILFPMSLFTPKRNPTPWINQYSLERQRGQLASLVTSLSQLSGVDSDEHHLQPRSPKAPMLTGIIKTLPVSSPFDLLKNAFRGWRGAGSSQLDTGHSPHTHSQTTAAAKTPHAQDSDPSKKVLQKRIHKHKIYFKMD